MGFLIFFGIIMFKKINLDHCYLEDKGFKLFKKLGKSGFNLEPMLVEHPGKAFCKFIAVQSGSDRENFYLEFIHVGKGGVEESVPGLSFSYKSDLKIFSQKVSKVTKIKFIHKNYDWKNNSIDYLPGWNMLTFKNKPLKNIYTWFTEFEFNKNRKILKKPKPHPNSVYSIHGVQLTLTEKSKMELEKILFKKLNRKNKLSDGSYLYIEIGKKDKLESVVLNCKSLKKFKLFFKKPELIFFQNKEAVLIRNFSRIKCMWNIVIIEN